LDGDTVTVYGRDVRSLEPATPLPCRESGSTLRFLLPLGWLMSAKTTFTGAPSLLSRPMDVYETLAREHDLTFTRREGEICVSGHLKVTELSVAGNISSQFISGLLFFLAAKGEGGTIRIHTTV
jgi:3-phosphoshikimate 1-carboxyvinyltransferase